jgi:GH24 family phage-related lysozyme (muramidase)
MDKLCGFVTAAGEKAYFFTGNRYVRYDVKLDQVDEGYPLTIAGQWPDLFADGIDAALPMSDGSLFFFRADQCLRYDPDNNAVLAGPHSIAEVWPGLFTAGIDAVVNWPSGNVFFFSGDQYQRYEGESGTVDPEPAFIADDWPGLFTSGIETALLWPDGYAYFFRAGQYSRYDPAHDVDAVVDGYPRGIEDWSGLPIAPDGPAGSTLSVREVFPAFSSPLEDRIPYLYQDILGLVTIGIGNLVDSPDAVVTLSFVHKDSGTPASRDEIVAEWQLIKNAPGLARAGHLAAKRLHTLELTDAAIDDLVYAKFDLNERRLAGFFPGWADWPADARLGAHSIAWSGSYFPNRWPAFVKADNAGDWKEAAAQSHLDETGNPGLVPRNRADRQLFLNAAAVIARGLDPSLIYYPTSL